MTTGSKSGGRTRWEEWEVHPEDLSVEVECLGCGETFPLISTIARCATYRILGVVLVSLVSLDVQVFCRLCAIERGAPEGIESGPDLSMAYG